MCENEEKGLGRPHRRGDYEVGLEALAGEEGVPGGLCSPQNTRMWEAPWSLAKWAGTRVQLWQYGQERRAAVGLKPSLKILVSYLSVLEPDCKDWVCFPEVLWTVVSM